MPVPLTLSEAAINGMAKQMGLDPPDAERMAILSAASTCEVQAGPGSGKTTLLALKLAILADQWPATGQGICVLSHTNAARREIESRMMKSASLRQLLDYPHFVGTFQRFVDQFLALPLLRQKGILEPQINNETFATKAVSAVQHPAYSTAKGWLSKKQPEQQAAIVGGLRYADSSLGISSAGGKLPGVESGTYKELHKLKHFLAKRGYFRFDDMFAVADRALAQFPYLRFALRRRFPWVFVDELQDTSSLQGKLLHELFPDPDCVVQCFGDRNQAIFDFDAEFAGNQGLFDLRPKLPLSKSRRFGPRIATIASRFTAATPQTLTGFANLSDHPHTLFVFKKTNVHKVVPRFAELVLERFPDAAKKHATVCVVGRRKRDGIFKKDNFPVSLADYWAGYDAGVASTPDDADCLQSYVIAARCAWESSGNGAEVAKIIYAGLLDLILAAHATAADAPRSRRKLREQLSVAGTLRKVETAVWKLVDQRQPLTGELWAAAVPELLEGLKPVLPSQTEEGLAKFIEWGAKVIAVPPGAPNSYRNLFKHDSAHGILPIRFETVHSVKGETHLATLLVETYSNKAHDLKSLVPVLTGDAHGSGLDPAKINGCMCAFVAITRPSELVCLAISADHVSAAELAKIQAHGWLIEAIAD